MIAYGMLRALTRALMKGNRKIEIGEKCRWRRSGSVRLR